MHKLCLIIPTKDRSVELERLFTSIGSQDVLPHQIIIVDGGDPGIKPLVDKYADLRIDYLQVLPPGLTRQRNAGLKVVKDDMDLIAFLDDDIVLEPGCIANMMKFWKDAPDDTGGAGFNIIDYPPSFQIKWLDDFYSSRFRGKMAGTLLSSGRNIPYCPAEETAETEWLCGGATVWRKKIFETYDFDEWFASYGIGEDVDFSYRVSKDYRLFVVSEARVQHRETARRNYYLQSFVITMNHLYLAQKHDKFSFPLCVAYFFINGLGRIILGLVSINKDKINKGLGYLVASIRGGLTGVARIERQVKD